MTLANRLHKQVAARTSRQNPKTPATAEPSKRTPLLIDAIEKDMEDLRRSSRSGVKMCHEQGKTAVYLSEDKQHIIHEPPHGPISRRQLPPARPDRSR